MSYSTLENPFYQTNFNSVDKNGVSGIIRFSITILPIAEIKNWITNLDFVDALMIQIDIVGKYVIMCLHWLLYFKVLASRWHLLRYISHHNYYMAWIWVRSLTHASKMSILWAKLKTKIQPNGWHALLASYWWLCMIHSISICFQHKQMRMPIITITKQYNDICTHRNWTVFNRFDFIFFRM